MIRFMNISGKNNVNFSVDCEPLLKMVFHHYPLRFKVLQIVLLVAAGKLSLWFKQHLGLIDVL